MATLKDIFLDFAEDETGTPDDNSVEVYADSVKQALELASDDLGIDISALDYEVVEKGTKDEEDYQIVGPAEADPAKGRISNESPVGRALMGKKKGDMVTVKTPAGRVNLKYSC